MYAYPLCLLFLSTGQIGNLTDDAAPSPLHVDSPQTLATPRFQQPDFSGAPAVASQPDRSAAPAFSLGSVYGGSETNSTPAGSETTPRFQQPSVSGTPTLASEPDRSAAPSFGLRSVYGGSEADLTPAGSQAPPALGTIQNAAVNSPATGPATSLLNHALRQPAELSIDGTPVSLQEIVAQTPVSGQQSAAVSAYWQLSQSLAEYHFALEEMQIFRGLSLPQAEHQRALLAAEEASAKARTAAARVNALRSQHALAEAAQRTDTTDLPLPSDSPFVGAYRTHFKVLNDRGAAPDHLGSIDRALPVMRESIEAQAEAVMADENALGATGRAYQQGQATLSDVLGIYHELRHQRRAFLSTVTEYNQQIARYASSVSLPGTGANRLVKMLIETPDAERSVLASKRSQGEIRRVSNEEEVDGWSDASLKRR